MFTKNWYIALTTQLGADDNSKEYLTSFTGQTGISYSTTYVNMLNSGAKYPCIARLATTSVVNSTTGVIIGSGNTPPTINDYKLENRITTPATASAEVSKTRDENGYTITSLLTITNTHSEDITIAEIGLYSTGSNSSAEMNMVLFERTVLDTPVTIPAGGIGQVTYTIRMNYPTA